MRKIGDSEARKAAETLEKYCIEHVYTAYWSIKCRLTT